MDLIQLLLVPPTAISTTRALFYLILMIQKTQPLARIFVRLNLQLARIVIVKLFQYIPLRLILPLLLPIILLYCTTTR